MKGNKMLTVLQVNVGSPQQLATLGGRDVFSSIIKYPVTEAAVAVERGGVAGDRQCDLSVHGGPLKAVYAYPDEHLRGSWPTREFAHFQAGISFGENLTTRGLTETAVHIGDEFVYGEDGVRLRVSKPRTPCYKLGLHLGRRIPSLMQQTGWCGWYFEVVSPGTLPAVGAVLRRVLCAWDAPTVAEVFAEKIRRNPAIPGMTASE